MRKYMYIKHIMVIIMGAIAMAFVHGFHIINPLIILPIGFIVGVFAESIYAFNPCQSDEIEDWKDRILADLAMRDSDDVWYTAEVMTKINEFN